MLTYDDLRAAYQQGDFVRVTYFGSKIVEVVGHVDNPPRVNVYVPGCGTVLFTEEELLREGNVGHDVFDRNVFNGLLAMIQRGHEIGDPIQADRKYVVTCIACGASMQVTDEGILGTAVTNMCEGTW